MKLLSFQDMGSHLEKVVLALGFFFFLVQYPVSRKVEQFLQISQRKKMLPVIYK